MNKRAITAMVLALLLPGLGHFYLGRRGRAGALSHAPRAERPERAPPLLPLRLSLALLRRDRAGVGDVPPSAEMKLAIVAGEASGDLHASEVVRELKKLDPALTTFGIGGDFLAREGMTLLHHAREMAIIGLFNVLRNIRFFKRVMNDFMEAI